MLEKLDLQISRIKIVYMAEISTYKRNYISTPWLLDVEMCEYIEYEQSDQNAESISSPLLN